MKVNFFFKHLLSLINKLIIDNNNTQLFFSRTKLEKEKEKERERERTSNSRINIEFAINLFILL
jgi:hypothetical protein